MVVMHEGHVTLKIIIRLYAIMSDSVVMVKRTSLKANNYLFTTSIVHPVLPNYILWRC